MAALLAATPVLSRTISPFRVTTLSPALLALPAAVRAFFNAAWVVISPSSEGVGSGSAANAPGTSVSIMHRDRKTDKSFRFIGSFLLVYSPAQTPGEAQLPPSGSGKNKNAVQVTALHDKVRRQKCLCTLCPWSTPENDYDKRQSFNRAKQGKPLQRVWKNCIISSMRCGLGPLCRWLWHLRRISGGRSPEICRIFCFSPIL